jgi:chemotaxis family two-component system response regulator Rcp1
MKKDLVERVIGAKIKKARIYRNFSRKEIANRLEVSESLIQQYENGLTRIPVSIFLEFCNLYQISNDDIIKDIQNEIEESNDALNQNNSYEIAVIEDNLIDQIVFKNAIDSLKANCKIHSFQDGQEALDFLQTKKHSVNIIFLDLNLLKRDGTDILRIIKSNSKLKKTPVIIVTSSNLKEDISKCYKLGCNGYIVKDLNKDKLLNDISKTLDYWQINSLDN